MVSNTLTVVSIAISRRVTIVSRLKWTKQDRRVVLFSLKTFSFGRASLMSWRTMSQRRRRPQKSILCDVRKWNPVGIRRACKRSNYPKLLLIYCRQAKREQLHARDDRLLSACPATLTNRCYLHEPLASLRTSLLDVFFFYLFSVLFFFLFFPFIFFFHIFNRLSQRKGDMDWNTSWL